VSAELVSAVAELIAEVRDLAERISHLEAAGPAPAQPPRTAWRVSEVAKSTGISYDQVIAMIKAGEIGHVPAGRLYIVPDEELRAFLARGRRLAVAS